MLPITSFKARIAGGMARATYTFAVAGINQTDQPWTHELTGWAQRQLLGQYKDPAVDDDVVTLSHPPLPVALLANQQFGFRPSQQPLPRPRPHTGSMVLRT